MGNFCISCFGHVLKARAGALELVSRCVLYMDTRRLTRISAITFGHHQSPEPQPPLEMSFPSLIWGLVNSLSILGVLRFLADMPVIGFYVRVILSFICLILCALYGVFASIALRAAGYGGLSQWTVARAFKYSMRLATGVEFVIQDEHHLKTRPAVLIGNHQTLVDVSLSLVA